MVAVANGQHVHDGDGNGQHPELVSRRRRPPAPRRAGPATRPACRRPGPRCRFPAGSAGARGRGAAQRPEGPAPDAAPAQPARPGQHQRGAGHQQHAGHPERKGGLGPAVDPAQRGQAKAGNAGVLGPGSCRPFGGDGGPGRAPAPTTASCPASAAASRSGSAAGCRR